MLCKEENKHFSFGKPLNAATLNEGKTTMCHVFDWTSGLTHVSGAGYSMLHQLGCAFTEDVPQRMDRDLMPCWLHNKGAFHSAIICCSVRQAVVAVAQQLQILMEDERLDLPLHDNPLKRATKHLPLGIAPLKRWLFCGGGGSPCDSDAY